MAPLIDYYDAAASDARKHSAKRLYHAVRKCDSLKAPAIFFAWEDCNFYVNNDENECVADWKSFAQLVDAVKYLTLKEVPKRQAKLHPLDVFVSAIGETTARDVDGQRMSHLRAKESFIIAASAATVVTNNKTPGAAFRKTLAIPTKLSNIPASFTKSPAKKRQEIWNFSHLSAEESFIIAASAASVVTNNKTPGAAFMKTLAIPTKLYNIAASAATVATNNKTPGAAFRKTLAIPTKLSNIAASAATLVTNNKTPGAALMETLAIPTKLSNIPASYTKSPAEKRQEIWNEKFQLLKIFQAEYGTCDCCAIGKDSSEKYKGLHTCVRTIRLVPGIYWRCPLVVAHPFSSARL
jgi:hypothetical protein